MQRSSETIGTIAAALAKAQAQLVNPEKSLVGTIPSDGRCGTTTIISFAAQHVGLASAAGKPFRFTSGRVGEGP